MRLMLPALLLSSVAAFAQGLASRPWQAQLERPFQAGGKVRLDLSAGGYHVVPVAEDGRIRVRWATECAEKMADARVTVDVAGGEAVVRTRGPRNNFEVVIEVPRRSDLEARLSVGELDIAGIEGHKDLRCRVGEVRVEVPDPKAYRGVEAAVKIGEISALPFGEGRDGFFRSVSWTGPGAYRLHARVGIGEVAFTPSR